MLLQQHLAYFGFSVSSVRMYKMRLLVTTVGIAEVLAPAERRPLVIVRMLIRFEHAGHNNTIGLALSQYVMGVTGEYIVRGIALHVIRVITVRVE